MLLKIIKHCKEFAPERASGILLGLDLDSRLEITNSFPIPDDDDGDIAEYQRTVMKNLRNVNVDTNTGGVGSGAHALNRHARTLARNYSNDTRK